ERGDDALALPARPLHQAPGEHRLDDDLPAADPRERVGEDLDAADLLLEAVPDGLRPDLEDAHQVVRLGVVGQEEQPHPGVRGAQAFRGHEAAVRLGRHADVEDRDVRRLLHQQLDEGVAVGGAADDLVPGRLEEHDQALAEQGSVLCKRYSPGILIVIVAAFGPLTTSIAPSRRRTAPSIASACRASAPITSTARTWSSRRTTTSRPAEPAGTACRKPTTAK